MINIQSTMLLNLPEDAWRTIALHLSPPDILSFLSVHRNINNHLAKNSASFWHQLTALHRDDDDDGSATTSTSCAANSVRDAKHEFMLQSYKSHLPSVQWIPLDINRTFPIDAREGHISCVLNTTDTNKSLIITGGFSDDESITVVSIPRGIQSYNETWGWSTMIPECRCSFVYGATLTPLPSSSSSSSIDNNADGTTNNNVHIARALRFGGFKSGGYSDETNEVWVLTIRTEEQHDDDDDGRISQTANWERIETNGTLPRPRAYHTATLIHDRYLVVIGGMEWRGSIIDEAILDISTWTWIDISLVCKGEPKGRHGHSIVWDFRRDRLVLFGGGSGTDLLRSGVDNDEVWQLKMNGVELPSMEEHGTSSKMWEWSKIHGDSTSEDEDDSSYDNDEDDDEDEEMNGTDESSISNNINNNTTANHHNQLSPTETLCLGRCHNGLKVAPDTVLLMFGGGRTNTNGVLGYDLRTDTFLRPKVTGPLPMPRFTGIASFLDTEGYIFVHGGYNSNQAAGCIQDMNLLDLAPFLNRPFTSLPVDPHRRSNLPTQSNGDRMEDGLGGRGGGNVLLGGYLRQNLLGLIDMGELEELMSRRGGRR